MVSAFGRGNMAKLFFGMNQSLDGYVDHTAFAPDAVLFRHFIDQARGLAGSIYGRHLYEIMRYWDDDQPEWTADERDFAVAWRGQRKWVASRTLTAVGPNATLLEGDIATAVRRLKDEFADDIYVGGPKLAHWLGALGLIDEYLLYLHPVVLGAGTPLFAGPLPRLRLVASDRIGEDTIRLTYVPA
jgi:dihydrofolate reductase